MCLHVHVIFVYLPNESTLWTFLFLSCFFQQKKFEIWQKLSEQEFHHFRYFISDDFHVWKGCYFFNVLKTKDT